VLAVFVRGEEERKGRGKEERRERVRRCRLVIMGRYVVHIGKIRFIISGPCCESDVWESILPSSYSLT